MRSGREPRAWQVRLRRLGHPSQAKVQWEWVENRKTIRILAASDGPTRSGREPRAWHVRTRRSGHPSQAKVQWEWVNSGN
jgi:hypothetical protein